MQPSSPVKSGSAFTPDTTAATSKHAGASASTSNLPRVRSPQPETKSRFDSPLRMHDFYSADPIFKKMLAALKVGGASADTRKVLDGFASQLETIRKAVLDAEKLFTPYSRKECALRLEAAKANQVRLLGEIDDVADSVLPAPKQYEIRTACAELGRGLSKMLVQAKELEKVAAEGRMSPPRAQQKRSQGHPDSPTLTASSPKRRKADAPPSQLPGSVSSPASKAAPQTDALPAYSVGDGGNASASTASTSTTASTSSNSTTPDTSAASIPSATTASRPARVQVDQSRVKSPGSPVSRNQRRLAAQPRPRPASQLFAAPPDFSAQARDALAPLAHADRKPQAAKSDSHFGSTSPDEQ
jgi:hypothetical protein